MAQGRGNAYAAALLLIIVGLHEASAGTYTVGGSKGWDLGVDYTTWAAGKTFHDGDILFFPYKQTEHNVVVVDKAGYDACSAANAVTTYSNGNTNVTLAGTGAHYYLCSVVGHCSGGMKLAVTVTATAAAPTASPPAAVPTKSPPAAPSKTPSSTPVTTPSTAPSPTSTPSSAPAPGPSAETPASLPSPSSPAPAPAGTPASSPRAPGSTPSSPGTPTSSSPPPPPNAAPSLLVSAAFAPLLTVLAAVFAL